MFSINNYLEKLIDKLKSAFGTRLIYVGLQGSYSRNEASESSDIDIVVILDELQMADMDTYRHILNALEYTKQSCGFICGKEEMKNWNPLEICQFKHETKNYYGELEPLLPYYHLTDVKNYVKLSVCNLFHMLCHEYIHAKQEERRKNLQFSYKAVFYLLQNLHYLRTGNYIDTKSELLSALSNDKDRLLLQTALDVKENKNFDFQTANNQLFQWCKETLKSM